MDEQNKFLDSLNDDQGGEVDILEQSLGVTGATGDVAPQVIEGDEEDDGIKPKNRRERRLLRKLEAEREASIFLAGKLEARTEATKAVTEESDYLKAVERIYGTDSPEAQLATDLLKKAIIGARDDAENRAYERIKSEREKEQEALVKAEQELDSFVEEIEDTYDVTLSDAQQKGFFQLLHKMSPKDKRGEVIEYADPHAVWEIFQEKLQKRGADNRVKDLSTRSMVNSGAPKENISDDVHARFLRENGII